MACAQNAQRIQRLCVTVSVNNRCWVELFLRPDNYRNIDCSSQPAIIEKIAFPLEKKPKQGKSPDVQISKSLHPHKLSFRHLKVLRARPSVGFALTRIGAARDFTHTKIVTMEHAPSTGKIITIDELRKLHNDAQVRIEEEERIKLEAKRIKLEAIHREVAESVKLQLDECVEKCRQRAFDGLPFCYFSFRLNDYGSVMTREQVREMYCTVLNEEIPLRLPGVHYGHYNMIVRYHEIHFGWA